MGMAEEATGANEPQGEESNLNREGDGVCQAGEGDGEHWEYGRAFPCRTAVRMRYRGGRGEGRGERSERWYGARIDHSRPRTHQL